MFAFRLLGQQFGYQGQRGRALELGLCPLPQPLCLNSHPTCTHHCVFAPVPLALCLSTSLSLSFSFLSLFIPLSLPASLPLLLLSIYLPLPFLSFFLPLCLTLLKSASVSLSFPISLSPLGLSSCFLPCSFFFLPFLSFHPYPLLSLQWRHPKT